MDTFFRNARARNTHVEETLNHPCPALVGAARGPDAERVLGDVVRRRRARGDEVLGHEAVGRDPVHGARGLERVVVEELAAAVAVLEVLERAVVVAQRDEALRVPGRAVVDDVPEGHERVAQAAAQFDGAVEHREERPERDAAAPVDVERRVLAAERARDHGRELEVVAGHGREAPRRVGRRVVRGLGAARGDDVGRLAAEGAARDGVGRARRLAERVRVGRPAPAAEHLVREERAEHVEPVVRGEARVEVGRVAVDVRDAERQFKRVRRHEVRAGHEDRRWQEEEQVGAAVLAGRRREAAAVAGEVARGDARHVGALRRGPGPEPPLRRVVVGAGRRDEEREDAHCGLCSALDLWRSVHRPAGCYVNFGSLAKNALS